MGQALRGRGQEWIYGPWNGMLYFVRFEGNRLSAIQSRRGD